MAYKLFKGKWPVTGEKPIISILSTGQICFNRACYDQFVKPGNCSHVKLYYEPETKKIAFQLVSRQVGETVFPIKLVKPGLFGLVNGKTFLNSIGIKYQEQTRSYPVHETTIHEHSPGYKLKWIGVKGIEISLNEYIIMD